MNLGTNPQHQTVGESGKHVVKIKSAMADDL